MSQTIKTIEFLDLSAEPQITIESVPPSPSDNPQIAPGRQVLVQTKRARVLNFYIVLEVVGQHGDRWMGKVVGQDGYQGPRDTVYPGRYFKFDFDGMEADDKVLFDQKNVARVF